jgi:acyl carrier protein
MDSSFPGQNMSPIEQTIHDYIGESFLSAEDAVSFRVDDDLLKALDSLQILRMLIDLEAKYSIAVDNSELTPENLGTVQKLAAFIARKHQESIC